MPNAFIDSSVLIGLHFRHGGEKAACTACLPNEGVRMSSRYVVFEIARGFLRSLLELHNASLEFASFSDLHQHAYSGSMRFKPYKMGTWLGAMTDIMAALEQEGVKLTESQKFEFFRSKLRVIIQRGWRKLLSECQFINEVGCQQNLPEPTLNAEGLLVQTLPVGDCGKINICDVRQFIEDRRNVVRGLVAHLTALPKKQKGNDTDGKHIPGLQTLLATTPEQVFAGKQCHRCGDAIICLEAPSACIIVSKNKGDFQPIANHLGKSLIVAISATTTTDSSVQKANKLTKFVQFLEKHFGFSFGLSRLLSSNWRKRSMD